MMRARIKKTHNGIFNPWLKQAYGPAVNDRWPCFCCTAAGCLRPDALKLRCGQATGLPHAAIERGAAIWTQIRLLGLQAGDDPGDIRDELAAQAEHVGRAGLPLRIAALIV